MMSNYVKISFNFLSTAPVLISFWHIEVVRLIMSDMGHQICQYYLQWVRIQKSANSWNDCTIFPFLVHCISNFFQIPHISWTISIRFCIKYMVLCSHYLFRYQHLFMITRAWNYTKLEFGQISKYIHSIKVS